MGKRVESLVTYLLTTLLADTEAFGRPVEPAQGFIDVIQQPAFLAGKQERLLTLHRVSPLIRHVKTVGRQVTVLSLERVGEGLVELSQLLDYLLTLIHEALLEVRLGLRKVAFELRREGGALAREGFLEGGAPGA